MTRVLFVADEHPWPARTGYRQRLDWVVRALADRATVDLVTVASAGAPVADPDRPVPLGTHDVVEAPYRPGGEEALFGRWLASRLPRATLARDWSALRSAVRDRLGERYDAVWLSHADYYPAVADLLTGPTVVDLDNLSSWVLRHRRRALAGRPARGLRAARSAARVAWDRGDARRWQRLEYRITARAAATVVCSDLDRQRLGGATVRVVPNVYEPARSPAPVSAASPPSAPVLLFVGFLGYEPNLDAARWFAEAVLPLVRQRRPDTQLLVVGRFESPAAVAGLRAADGVTVTGEVADLAPVLAGARAAVVPIRFGGGTRVKILEAFAAGLPVVTTSVGAEGLSVRDGEQLLVADDPRGFAEACLRLLADPALAAGVAGRGRAFWEQHHRPDALGSAVGQVLDAVLP